MIASAYCRCCRVHLACGRSSPRRARRNPVRSLVGRGWEHRHPGPHLRILTPPATMATELPRQTLRLKLKPKAPATGYVDGAWWPRSRTCPPNCQPCSRCWPFGWVVSTRVSDNLSAWDTAQPMGSGDLAHRGVGREPIRCTDRCAEWSYVVFVIDMCSRRTMLRASFFLPCRSSWRSCRLVSRPGAGIRGADVFVHFSEVDGS